MYRLSMSQPLSYNQLMVEPSKGAIYPAGALNHGRKFDLAKSDIVKLLSLLSPEISRYSLAMQTMIYDLNHGNQ